MHMCILLIASKGESSMAYAWAECYGGWGFHERVQGNYVRKRQGNLGRLEEHSGK